MRATRQICSPLSIGKRKWHLFLPCPQHCKWECLDQPSIFCQCTWSATNTSQRALFCSCKWELAWKCSNKCYGANSPSIFWGNRRVLNHLCSSLGLVLSKSWLAVKTLASCSACHSIVLAISMWRYTAGMHSLWFPILNSLDMLSFTYGHTSLQVSYCFCLVLLQTERCVLQFLSPPTNILTKPRVLDGTLHGFLEIANPGWWFCSYRQQKIAIWQKTDWDMEGTARATFPEPSARDQSMRYAWRYEGIGKGCFWLHSKCFTLASLLITVCCWSQIRLVWGLL